MFSPGRLNFDELGGQLAIVRKGNETIYEMVLPMAEITEYLTPGTVMGYGVLINDNDGDGRRGWIEYGDGISWRKDPSKYGDITIVEE